MYYTTNLGIFTYGLSPLFYKMPNEVNAAGLPFYSIFVLQKVFFFRKFLITLLHVI